MDHIVNVQCKRCGLAKIRLRYRSLPFDSLPYSTRTGTFREEERLRLSGRNSMLVTQTDVLIINRVAMGFQIQICPILCVLWSILVKCCVLLPTSSSKTQILLQEKTMSTNIDCYVRDSSRLHLTFVAFCLLSVIRKQ